MNAVRRAAAALVTVPLLLLVPSGTPSATTMSLVAVETAQAVEFDEGVVWVLAIGSDSRDGDPRTGNADAIELIALDTQSRRAVAIGIARDSWVNVGGEGFKKINSALNAGGPELVAAEVTKLTGITPQYIFATGYAAFEQMVDVVGVLQVHSDFTIDDPRFDLTVHEGVNQMDGATAAGFARTRELPTSDFGRQANQQHLLEAILRQLRAHQDEEGFIEAGALSALAHLDTDLSPPDLYRFAQAITLIDPKRTRSCVIGGTDEHIDGQDVVFLDTAQAQRVAADADDDAKLQGGCD